MLILHKRGSTLPTSVARFVAILGFAVAAAARAEPPLSLPANSTVKPLARIGKETAGFAVTCFALAPQGDVVALGSDDGKIRLWSLAENKLVRTVDATSGGYISSIAFSPDARRLTFHAD